MQRGTDRHRRTNRARRTDTERERERQSEIEGQKRETQKTTGLHANDDQSLPLLH